LGWFEPLYSEAGSDSHIIPWADMSPNPKLIEWLDSQSWAESGGLALKVGCGLGDDAEELASRGWSTTAFDISDSAIDWCHRRFPNSSVQYLVSDLFDAPAQWSRAFDLVVESYTLQVLPPSFRAEAIRRISEFVAPGGRLLVISRAREAHEPVGEIPWPLTAGEVALFDACGLARLGFEDFFDDEDPPVRRFTATYARG